LSGKDILLVVVIPLLLAELGPWCGWLAGELMPGAARLRYGRGDRAVVRAEEWSDDLGSIPGQLSKLAYSLAQLIAGSIVGARRKIERMSFGDGSGRTPVRGISYRVPYALLWIASRRLSPELRDRYDDEWLPELEYLLLLDESRRLTQCMRGTAFSAALAFSVHNLARRHCGKGHLRWDPPTGGPSDPSS
jgi:hypothetical protein